MKKLITFLVVSTVFLTSCKENERKITAPNQSNKSLESKTIVFIHGMFMNSKSWDTWVKYFEERGYRCYAPSYPFHVGEPAELRENISPELASLTLGQIVSNISIFLSTLPEKPILIGHSMGGLVVQKLISQSKGVAGICIDSAPPVGVFSLEWSFLKANLPIINPIKGDTICIPTVDWFHYAFCNTMTMEETAEAFNRFIVPESRNIPRSSSKADGFIDFKKPHPPLLFIAGEKDHIIPASLNKKNFKAYRDKNSKKDFHQFSGRTHYICGQKNWEEVASYCTDWILAKH